jgi:hypothetical protein
MIQLMAKPEDFLNTLRFLTTMCWSETIIQLGLISNKTNCIWI